MSKSVKICGVPQCKSEKGNGKGRGISLFSIPPNVLKNKIKLKEWMVTLKIFKQFPMSFKICSLHFENKYLLVPQKNAAQRGLRLSTAAFPTLNLPSTTTIIIKCVKSHQIQSHLKSGIENKDNFYVTESVDDENVTHSDQENPMTSSVCVQTDIIEMKNVQCQANRQYQIYITENWDTDSKLYTKTGIPSRRVLEAIVKCCTMVDADEHSLMSLRDRILLTMHKLKNNCSFAEIAIDFVINRHSAKNYFCKTIQLLAKVMEDLIYWPSREQTKLNLPSCFRLFPNVMSVLDCTEIRTVKFSCLFCRTCTYSFYKGGQTVKILIGVSPSGLINYISPMSCGKSSDKAIFNSTNLLSKLQPGDALMVDKGFMIGKELLEAGIEMIRPPFLFESFSNTDVKRNAEIARARVHIERRISRLKQFKVLSDKICMSVLPYIDDVMIVICGISNLSNPILKDDKF